MDGKGCYQDNIFVERLWRSVKYECVYLKAFKDGAHLKQELGRYFAWYNQACLSGCHTRPLPVVF
jgi:putative transposase